MNIPRSSVSSYIIIAIVTLSIVFIGEPVMASTRNPVIVGDARFTVVTPDLIRLEYQPTGSFVDLPSIFAAERGALDLSPVNVISVGGSTIIETGQLVLTYTPDGKPFDSTNLSVLVIPNGTRWTPGMNDPGNLGGTNRTLDGVAGPVDVGQGVLSRSGWAVVDDSQSQLLTPDGWVESRPDSQKAGLDWYFFGYGSNYRRALTSLMTVSGSVPMPRRYALGVWYSRYWPWSDSDYRNIVTKYGTEGFPLDNVVLDMDWHKDGWTGWSWNTKLLPDAPALLAWFHSRGLHDTINLHPADGVAPYEDQYAPFMKGLGLDPTTQVTVPFDAGSKPYMDDLFATVLDPLKNNGVDFWWLDWQQYPFTKSVPDLTNLFWLNTLLYNYTSDGGQRGMSFSRWAGWGDQRHPIHFSGDANTGFSMLAFEVPFTSTAGNVGCFFWSHDIGGHLGGRNEESYTRWCQFGSTAPVLRSHSTRDPTTDRVPWNYPKWAEDSMRISLRLRSQLFPYIYTSAQEACAQNVPLDRPVYLDLPNIEDAYHNGQEFLLGDNILVSPIAAAGAGSGHVSYQTVWLPPTTAGYWYDLLNGEREQQLTNVIAARDIDEFPIFVRGGVPIPMQPFTPRMGTTQVTTLRVRVYPGRDGQSAGSSLYEDDGVTTAYLHVANATTQLEYKRHGKFAKLVVFPTVGAFSGQPVTRAYNFEFADIDRPLFAAVDGAKTGVTYDPSTYTASVAVRQLPINRTITVIISGYRPDGWKQLRRLDMQRRIQESVDTLVYNGAPSGLINAALSSTSSPAERTAVFASAGLAVDHKNIATTFYPESYQDDVYVPSGMIDGNVITVPGGAVVPIPPQGLAGMPIGQAAGFKSRIGFKIEGQSYELPPPGTGIGSDDNVAWSAVATASSVQAGSPSVASAAIDGVVGGYPGLPNNEWASNAEKTGAWLQLNWTSMQTVDRVWLYDRPNLSDRVTSGTITFSDGSSVAVGSLPNDASAPYEVTFPSKTISWLKFTITGVSQTTQNAGISEIAVFKAGSHPTP